MKLPPRVERAGRQASAFWRLSLMSGRDMFRNPLTGLSMWFMAGIILIIYVSMWVAFMVLGPAPVASVAPNSRGVAAELERVGVPVVAQDAPERNAHVTLNGDRAEVVLDSAHQPAWEPLWQGLRKYGIGPNSIIVTDDTGDIKVDLLKENLGIVVLLGVASVAFIGATVPIVAMREQGLLRLMGTTPLRRSTFLLAQLPARLVVTLTVVATTTGIAIWRKYVDGLDVFTLGKSSLIGTAMLFSFALLFATRSRNAVAMQEGMVMLTILLVFASGGLLPASIVPEPLQFVLNCLPTTWFAAATSASLAGAEPFLPIPVLWALMLACTAIVAVIAARLFVWDQFEPKSKSHADQSTKTRVKS